MQLDFVLGIIGQFGKIGKILSTNRRNRKMHSANKKDFPCNIILVITLHNVPIHNLYR